MKNNIFYVASIAAMLLCGCEGDDSLSSQTQYVPGNSSLGGMGGSTTTTATISGLTDFEIAFNTEAISESSTQFANDNDYVENVSFDGRICISFDGDKVVVDGDEEGVVSVNGADLTIDTDKAYELLLTGSTTNGSLTVNSAKALALLLDGVELGNADGAAVNIQTKATTYVVAMDGSSNSLTDGSRTDDNAKVKGAFFTKGKAVFSGKGNLVVNGNYKNGISTKKDLVVMPNTNIYVELDEAIEKGSCLKCENTDSDGGLFVYGGVINLSNPTAAGKGLSADGNLTIYGGRVTAICTGDGLWEEDETDVSGSAGVKCDSTLCIKGGELYLMSTGKGGKGINGDYVLNFDGGSVRIVTTGTTHTYQYNGFTYDTSPKGIKCDGVINVAGGEIFVRATGTSDGSEGIEAKQIYNQTGGNVYIYAADDGLNTGYSSESLREKQQMGVDISGCVANKGEINIMGGLLMSYTTSNDALDSNGFISISGGTVIAYGAGAPETSFDCDENSRMSVTGGTLFGLAGAAPNTPSKECTQCFAVSSFNATANTQYCVKADDGTEIISVTVPRSYSNAALVVSSPEMKKGSTYSIGNSSFTTSSSSWITNTAAGGMGGGRPW